MKRPAPNGFTLLELLLAVTLLSLMTSAIMGGLHLGRRGWETRRVSDALDEVENAVRATAGLIGRARAPGQQAQGQQLITQDAQPAFRGSAGRCRFIAFSEGGAQWGGLILTEVGVEPGPEGLNLAVWTMPYHTAEDLAAPLSNMRKTVILRGVATFELSFFGPPEVGAPSVWSGAWTQRERPALVTIAIGANRLGRLLSAAATVGVR